MGKKYNTEAGNKLFEEVAKQSENKAKAIVLRYIPDEKLVDYPENNEDISKTADIEQSIEEQGFTDPIEVTPFGQPDGCYMILSGHRRRMAGRKVGMTEFPCIVKDHLKTALDVENYVLSANRHRDSGKDDPLLLVNRALKEANYLEKAGVPKKEIQERVAKRMGLSISSVSRYLAVSKVIPQVQDMVRAEVVGVFSVSPLATRSVEVQEIIYNVMQEALAADVELTRSVVNRIIAGCEAGKRTWVAISANPEQTKDSGLPLNGFINPDSGETKEDAPGNRNDEVNREFDPIAAEYDAIEVDREKYEESQMEQDENSVDTSGEEETPVNDPKPPLSEHEQEMENGKAIMKAVSKLNGVLEKTYGFASSEEAAKAIDTLTSTVSAIVEEICRIANKYRLSEDGKSALEKCGDDSVTFMGYIK